MPTTQDAYLHTISGGYDEQKRKAVRKLFQGDASDEPDEPPHDITNYDLIVGAVEEIHYVGVKQFSIAHVKQILAIFGVSHFLEGNIDDYIEQSLAIMGCGRHQELFTTPDGNKIEGLRRQHCGEEKQKDRLESLSSKE